MIVGQSLLVLNRGAEFGLVTQSSAAFGEAVAVVRDVRVFVGQSGKYVPCLPEILHGSRALPQ
jgi:hypothetical protein